MVPPGLRAQSGDNRRAHATRNAFTTPAVNALLGVEGPAQTVTCGGRLSVATSVVLAAVVLVVVGVAVAGVVVVMPAVGMGMLLSERLL